jgi:hypothetical protein
MKTNRSYLAMLFIATLLQACSSGMSALKEGNLDEALAKSIDRLRKNSEKSKALFVLKEAYPIVVQNHLNLARTFENSSMPFHWEKALNEYQTLQAISDNLASCPSCTQSLGIRRENYLAQLNTTKQLAADERFEAGMNALAQKQNRLMAKEAFYHFKRSAEIIPNYKQADAKAAEAFEAARYRVLIQPLNDIFRLHNNEYQYLQGRLADNILGRKNNNPFVAYQTQPTIGNQLNHDVVTFALLDYVPWQVNEFVKKEVVEREIKVGRKKKSDSTYVDVFEKVSGVIFTHTREIRAIGTMEMRVLNTLNNQVTNREEVQRINSWTNSWQTFKGDERAIQGRCLKTRQALGEPTPFELFRGLSNDLSNHFCGRLQDFYRGV